MFIFRHFFSFLNHFEHGTRGVKRVAVIGLALMVGACMSLNEVAPPVDQALLQGSGPRGADPQLLTSGREVYLGRCIGCHNPEPIGRYSVEEWRKILPRMAEEAELDHQEKLSLEAYVFTVRDFMGQRVR